MAKTTSERIAFVEGLELSHPPIPDGFKMRTQLEHPVVSADNKKEADVVAGSVVAFTDKVKGQAKQDIKNATLFAQFTANKKYNRQSSPREWYQFYEHVLETIGFTVEKFDFNKYDSHETVGKAAIDTLHVTATGSSLQALTSALDSIAKMDDHSSHVSIFSSHTTTDRMGNFQLAACDQSPDGVVSFALGAFYFLTHTHTKRILGIKISHHKHTEFYRGASKAILNATIFGPLRQKIAEKLGDCAVAFVDSLEI